MSGHNISNSDRFPSDHSSELQRAAPAVVGPGGSVRTELTPTHASALREERGEQMVVNWDNKTYNDEEEAAEAILPTVAVGQSSMVVPGSSSAQDSSAIADDVVHRLVAMGVLVYHSPTNRIDAGRAERSTEDEQSVSSADSTGSGAAGGQAAAGATKRDRTGKNRSWKRPSPVHVPKFPTASQVPQWEETVARALVASSVYDDKKEVKWFKRASQEGVTFEELGNVGEERFHALDALRPDWILQGMQSLLH